jgi:hypothetical protein
MKKHLELRKLKIDDKQKSNERRDNMSMSYWVRHKIKIRYETYKKIWRISMQKIIVIDVIIQLTVTTMVCLTKMLSVRIAKKQRMTGLWTRNTESEEVKKVLSRYISNYKPINKKKRESLHFLFYCIFKLSFSYSYSILLF